MSFARVGVICCSRVLKLGDHQIREYFATHAGAMIITEKPINVSGPTFKACSKAEMHP